MVIREYTKQCTLNYEELGHSPWQIAQLLQEERQTWDSKVSEKVLDKNSTLRHPRSGQSLFSSCHWLLWCMGNASIHVFVDVQLNYII